MELTAALKEARGETTQQEIGEVLGVGQPTVSKWERGKQVPTLDEIMAFEKASRRARGWVLVRAGYVEGVSGVEQALADDDKLTATQREHVRQAYRGGLILSAEERQAQAAVPRRRGGS